MIAQAGPPLRARRRARPTPFETGSTGDMTTRRCRAPTRAGPRARRGPSAARRPHGRARPTAPSAHRTPRARRARPRDRRRSPPSLLRQFELCFAFSRRLRPGCAAEADGTCDRRRARRRDEHRVRRPRAREPLEDARGADDPVVRVDRPRAERLGAREARAKAPPPGRSRPRGGRHTCQAPLRSSGTTAPSA